MNSQERREARNLAAWHREKSGWKKKAERDERLKRLQQQSVWLYLLARLGPVLLGLAATITLTVTAVWWIDMQYPWLKYAGFTVGILLAIGAINAFFEEQDIRWRARIWMDEGERHKASRDR